MDILQRNKLMFNVIGLSQSHIHPIKTFVLIFWLVMFTVMTLIYMIFNFGDDIPSCANAFVAFSGGFVAFITYSSFVSNAREVWAVFDKIERILQTVDNRSDAMGTLFVKTEVKCRSITRKMQLWLIPSPSFDIFFAFVIGIYNLFSSNADASQWYHPYKIV